MRTTLVLDALKMALGTREHAADLALVHHSDAGSQGGSNRPSQDGVGVAKLIGPGSVGALRPLRLGV